VAEQTVVIVGAGLGGLRTAESLRSHGFTGKIQIVGDEMYLPYNRPPLSKDALKSELSHEDLKYRLRDTVSDIEWILGEPATQLHLDDMKVSLANGTELSFDGLVIATGIRPRLLPIPGPTSGLFTLRNLTEAQLLREVIKPGENLVIIGSGFIGCEVAATATQLGATVQVVSLDQEPMMTPLGIELGKSMRQRHESKGVTFHLGRTVTEFNGSNHITGVTLDNGEVLPTNIVVEAVGSVPNTEWLEGNGLDTTNGVLVDQSMHVLGTDLPVVAVGDIARHPHPLYLGESLRIEHWNMPTETGKLAGATLAAILNGVPTDQIAFSALPSFWSDQYEFQIQSYGVPGIACTSKLVSGAYNEPCIVEYFDAEGGLCGVVGIDTVRELLPYRKQLLSLCAVKPST
jgi:3-phenylpropionate/trans-cinnamate dioxygenase ferredoxin reductase component